MALPPRVFLKVPCVGLQCVIVVFPDHTHLLTLFIYLFIYLSVYFLFIRSFICCLGLSCCRVDDIFQCHFFGKR